MKPASDTLPPELMTTSAADEVARWIVARRLKRVRQYLGKASSKPVTAETVHRLRVASREAQAVLQVCAPLLPKRRARRMQRALRQILAAAGPARELAVMQTRLEHELPNIVQSDLRDVLAEVEQRRVAQLRRMRRKYRKQNRRRFHSQSKRLVARIRWRGEGDVPSWIVLARAQLAKVAEAFLAATDQLDSVRDLHRLRLRCKRFRYALEAVQLGNGTAASRTLRTALKELQDTLGVVNDHASDQRRVTKWMAKQSAEGVPSSRIGGPLAIIAEHSQQGMARMEILFRQWWTDQRVAEFERAWRALCDPDSETVANAENRAVAAQETNLKPTLDD